MKYILPLLATSYVLVVSLHAQTSPAPAPSTAPSTAPSDSSTPPVHHPHHPDFVSQLTDLTDDQKTKIANIKATVKDPKDRHTQIFAALTPDQVTEVNKMMADWKAAHPKPPAPASTSTTPAAPAPATPPAPAAQ